jgi:cytochrome b involved in lipid metabolism
MKKILILVPFILLLAGIGYIVVKSKTPVTETQTVALVDVQQPPTIDSQTSPTPLPDQTTQTSLSGSINLADIAKHAVEGNCWTAIDGSVYDLSSFTSQHPGGPVILSVCGKDGSELFHGQHGEREKRRVESMIIGSLAK